PEALAADKELPEEIGRVAAAPEVLVERTVQVAELGQAVDKDSAERTVQVAEPIDQAVALELQLDPLVEAHSVAGEIALGIAVFPQAGDLVPVTMRLAVADSAETPPVLPAVAAEAVWVAADLAAVEAAAAAGVVAEVVAVAVVVADDGDR